MSNTEFAPATRSGTTEIRQQADSLHADPLLPPVLDAIPGLLAVLNPNRQIILANRQFLQALGLEDFEAIIGKRPGEAFNCIHSHGQGGCGTSEACRYCGAVQAVLLCMESHTQTMREGRLTVGGPKGPVSMDVRVCASPFFHQNAEYTLVTIHDISTEKRKQVLERLFFHDVINTAGGLSGLAELLSEEQDQNDARQLAGQVYTLSTQLLQDIIDQRQLSAAEAGDLEVNLKDCALGELVRASIQAMVHHQVAQNKRIELSDSGSYPICRTDPALARRIITNMLKNALEASPPGSTIVASLAQDHRGMGGVRVQNPGVMPREVQMQLFQRSFSTKGSGRGLGTYSMRLFAEQYLGGTIAWESSEQVQTVFYAWLPLSQGT